MSDTLTLSAQTRDRAGKGASRALRLEGRVPAVVYGNKQEPVSITVEEKALVKALSTGHFMNTLVMIDGIGAAIRTLPKDVQFHPVNDRPLHVDFLRVGEHAKVTVDVPVVFTGEEDSPGLKRGGVLNIVHHELSLTCDAAEIPSEIIVKLDGLEVGDTIHLSAIKLPRGVEVHTSEEDFTIATIVAPSALKSQGEEDAAADEEAAAEASAEAAAETEGEAPEGDAEASTEE